MCWRALSCGGLIVLAGVLATPGSAQDAAREEPVIRAAAKSYLAALARGDRKAVAASWTADGEFIDAQGQAHPAAEIAAETEPTTGDSPRPEIRVTSSKIRFLTPDVAIEDGASEVAFGDAKEMPPARGRFHATWVKQDGRWRLAHLREIAEASPAPPRLADLDWMVGNWIAESDGAQLEMTAAWNSTATFLLRDTKAIRDGQVVFQGSQRIGWDPLSGNLRSWSFDSLGGFGEAVWTTDGNSWVEKATGVLSDARQTSATAVITPDGNNRFTRKLSGARIDDEPLPDDEVRFTRRADSKR